MAAEIDPVQFPRQTWQLVSDQARRCLVKREFCPEQSRIENLRCVHFEDETEQCFGLQVWHFEALAIDPVGRRHMLFGALNFSVQFGLVEPSQTALFEDSEQRQSFYDRDVNPPQASAWDHMSTRFWVQTACIGVLTLAVLWTTMVIQMLYHSAVPK
jgi:hypothetical protein